MANHIKQGNVNTARTLKELAEEVSTLASMAKDVMTDKHGNFFDRYSELKMRHDVNNVLNGKTNSAQVKAAGLKDLPINYTQDVHNRLLSKHPDDMNASFINNLEHLETLRNPDMVYEDTPRDVQYRRMDIMDDDLAGRVSVKPLNSDGASYINTAHVMDGKEAARGVPTLNGKFATAEDFAFSRASNVDANTNISQNNTVVNRGNVHITIKAKQLVGFYFYHFPIAPNSSLCYSEGRRTDNELAKVF